MSETLSLENKRKLLDIITERCINYTTQKIELGLVFDPDTYIDDEKRYGIISFYMSRFIDDYKKEIEIQYEKSLQQAEKDVPSFYFEQSSFKEALMSAVVVTERSKLWATIFEHYSRTVDPETISVSLNITNYKPCHNIRLLSDDKLFDVQIRSHDIVLYGNNYYGRKVGILKSSIVTDDTLEKDLKRINFT